MINTKSFIDSLRLRGVSLFVGVPDSLLKDFSGCLMQTAKPNEHIITANEGNAVGLAIGHYLGKGKPAVVYMQNSGLGNAINPITSLADRDVYGIPMLFIIGLRGEPGLKDEPQHFKQGRITIAQLDILEIPYRIIDAETNIDSVLDEIWPLMLDSNGPVALVVRKNSLDNVGYKSCAVPKNWPSSLPPLYREPAIDTILDTLNKNSCIVATTGKTGREVFELRMLRKETQRDFLTVGGMGHASSIALGIAIAQPQKKVICLDGDGSLIMHMGSLAINASTNCPNLIHILLNNQAHESVGGQPTVAGDMDFKAIALACGYKSYNAAHTLEEIQNIMNIILKQTGPHFFEIHLYKGSRIDLGRPSYTPAENKQNVMNHLGVS